MSTAQATRQAVMTQTQSFQMVKKLVRVSLSQVLHQREVGRRAARERVGTALRA